MMKNVTVVIHERIYRQARVWAAQRDTSLSAVVASILETLLSNPTAARIFPLPQPAPAPKTALLPDEPATAPPPVG